MVDFQNKDTAIQIKFVDLPVISLKLDTRMKIFSAANYDIKKYERKKSSLLHLYPCARKVSSRNRAFE